MTLTDIKEKIKEQLGKLTIDDFYSDPEISFAKQTFSEITKLKTDEDFEVFLKDKFPETTAEALRFSLNQTITDFNKQITNIEEEIKSSRSKIEKLETQVSDKKEKQSDIPKQQEKTKSELTDIEIEINQIRPLAGKPPYDKQIEGLEKEKERKSKELEDYSIASTEIEKELDELHASIKSEKEFIAQKQSEIQSIQTLIGNKQKELEQLQERDNTHFKNEYSSLEFLFKILLHQTISISKFIDRGNQEKQTLYNRSCQLSEVYKYIISFTNSRNTIPKDWRQILNQILSTPIPEIDGKITDLVYLERESLELTHTDITTLLATKIAVRTKHSIRTADNRIILALSGGIAVSISFREKGDLISKFQNKPLEVFANCLKTSRFVLQPLYRQIGYANSSVNIETPGGYYILTDKFVIEIEFLPAPILFDDNSVLKFAPNISGIAKHEDEMEAEEKRRQDEYDRRRRDDDYYYD